ncbi:sigma-70 family RNA polymerase sigma factor [Actinoallomurus sp. CA-150999]|uniref:sigma-70 family RNA polymerase sigma factor n=1 Tax=Actinoallomurus sp. CA-150999 TaxID=3239887 RepID=UPI003D912AD7
MRTEVSEDLVAAAQAGDHDAREQLVSECLPLVYNVIGRALGGHADVDDLVQETLLRVMNGLGGLRDRSRFRSWLVTVAMNEVRRRWSANQKRPVVDLEAVHDVPDPAADFVELTILRLGLSGQRREVAEATRWLDPDDRELLALWWLEASGRLTRSELAAALDCSARHVAVRIQRMKERLDSGRAIVRALGAHPRCRELSELTAHWDGRPAPVWRKRIARHIRSCRTCSEQARGLVPAEALLAGLALVPPPPHTGSTPFHTGGHATLGRHRRMRRPRPGRTRTAIAGTAVAAIAVFFIWSIPRSPDHQPTPAGPTTTARRPAPERRYASATTLEGSVTRTHRPVTPTGSASPGGVEQQVVSLVNTQRAKNGCGPLRVDGRLHTAAQRHSDDMAARHFFDHTDPDGKSPGDRITATGYRWSGWAENIAAGQQTPTAVMNSWMNSPGHRANILNCGYKDIGVGVADGRGGPWWTQDFATPQ